MKITTKLNSTKNVRYHILEGIINVPELLKYLKEIYNSFESGGHMNSCWDLQDADFTSLNSEDIELLIQYVSKHWGKGGNKSALVVSDDFEFGMSRMYQTLLELRSSSEINISRDIEEAKKWLEPDQKNPV